jgi:hypothetical protein
MKLTAKNGCSALEKIPFIRSVLEVQDITDNDLKRKNFQLSEVR